MPPVLLGGDHAAISSLAPEAGAGRTWLRRSDLIERLTLDEEQRKLLRNSGREQN